MRTMMIQYPSYFFRPEDFLESANIKKPITADVRAAVTPNADFGLDVEIISIKYDGRELLPYLKRDPEWAMEPLLRSFYLNEARRGKEGDAAVG